MDGEVVFTLPDTYYFWTEGMGEGEKVYIGQDDMRTDQWVTYGWDEDDPDKEPETFNCSSSWPTIRCPLPYLEGHIRYFVVGALYAQIDACEGVYIYGEDVLVINNPPLEPAEEVCYSEEPYSFDNAKVNYWFAQVPTTDLHLSIVNDVPFLHAGYTGVLMQATEGATPITAECPVSSKDPNRVDCAFVNFPGPSGTWIVTLTHNSCGFFMRELWIGMPLCPAGETHHAEWPYNNRCCTDGCWCEYPGYGWGCWESCAPHCAS